MLTGTALRLVLSRIGFHFKDAVALGLWHHGLLDNLIMESEQLDVVHKQHAKTVGVVG